jgi:phage replication O-like protein O
MTTPQIENGFTMIANELLEAILGGGFSHREQSVLLAIIRKTYGYAKKEDDMSAAQIGALCGVARQHVTSTLNALAGRNVIGKRAGRFGMIIGIQKDHRKWISGEQLKALASAADPIDFASPDLGLVPKQDTSQNGTGGSPDSGQGDSPESGHTKETLPKENHQNKKPCAPQADRDQVDEKTPAGQKGRAKTGLTAELADRFERFYAAYPLKKSRGTAEKAFGKLRPDEDMLAQLLAGLEKRRASGTWIDPKFIPYPASWLNAKGWLDVIDVEYTPEARAVIDTFNELLGAQLGEVSSTIFVPARAALIADFLTFQTKPDLARRYFTWLRDDNDLPPKIGFDRLVGRQGYADATGGKFTRKP